MKYTWLASILLFTIITASTVASSAFAQSSYPSPSNAPSTTVTGSMSESSSAAFSDKSFQLRLNTNALMREHTVMTGEMLAALYLGKNTSRMEQLMNDNTNMMATLLDTYYGAGAKNTFVSLWNQHMQEYKNYTMAAKNNDTTKMNTARKNLQAIATKLGNMFPDKNNASEVTSMMHDHVNGTLSLVDAIKKNDPTQIANLSKNGYDQAGDFADTITRIILSTKSDSFK